MGEQLYISRTLMCDDLLKGVNLRFLARPAVSLYKRVVEVYEFMLGDLQGGEKNEGV